MAEFPSIPGYLDGLGKGKHRGGKSDNVLHKAGVSYGEITIQSPKYGELDSKSPTNLILRVSGFLESSTDS